MKDIKNSVNDVDQILIAEDSPTQAEQLKNLLEKYYYKVVVAKDGKEALNLIRGLKPSLVISDIIMPEMNGYELCKELKSVENTTNIPVILLTSLDRSEDVLEGISCGADNFITKPYCDDYLISHVKQILSNRKIYKNEQIKVGMEIVFGDKKRFITTNQQQMLTLLISTYEAAVQKNKELIALNEHLEDVVSERTKELSAEIVVRRRTEERVIKLNHIYAMLSNINQTIARIHDINLLLNDACNIIIDDGKFKSAWIGILDNKTNKIETFATVGLASDLAEISSNQNPVSGVIRAEKHFISNCIDADNSIPEIWKLNALSLGLKSFAAFPLTVYGKVIGVFCIYSDEVDSFDEHETSLLDEMAIDISFALEYIQKETERKQAEEELVLAKEKAEESDRLKTAFLHNISHEIRTPMNAIVGFSELLKDPELLSETRNHFTDIIIQNSYQLLSIISDIISIATIEAGQVKTTEKEIDLNSTLKLLSEQFQQKNQKQNVCLMVKNPLPDNEAFILSDETKLVQILTNLIGNAIKFTMQGHVKFGYSVKGNELEFFVEDTGIGIPPEMQQEVFKRFSQVESTLARQFGGSGLGLSISKAYVELLGGKMWLNSELDKGSTFYFTLPYKKAQKNTFSEKQFANSIKTEVKITKTLLIAEDEDSNFMLLKEVLSDFSINIIRAINGIEAINICKMNKDINLVLMDIKMPVMDGYEATRQIKGFMPNLPIIAQTAYSTDIDKNKALACGCNDFISKPYKKEFLICKIKEQLFKN